MSSSSSKSFHNPIVVDSRFGHVHTDPRFRRKPKEEKTFRVDPRFQRMFTDKAFQINADVVDKWGRRRTTQGQDPLKKLYRLDDDDGDGKQDESDDEIVFDEPGKKGKEKKQTQLSSALKPSKTQSKKLSTSSPSLTSTSTSKYKKSTSSESPSFTSTSAPKSKKSSSTSSSSLISSSTSKSKKSSSSSSPSLQPSASKKATSSLSLTSSKKSTSSSSQSLTSSTSSKSHPDFPDFILSDDAADESDSDYTPPKDDLEGDEDDDAAVAMDIRGFNEDENEDESTPMGLPSDDEDEDEEEIPKVRNPKLMKLLAESGGMDDADDDDQEDDNKEKDEDEDDDEDERDIGNAIYEGFSTSSDEEFDDIDPNDIAELAPAEEENIPEGEPSRRIAIMNMEWDRVKSQDLYVLLRSFLPNPAGVQSVHIYPSEYGKKRMTEESKYGPLGLYNLEEAEQKKRELDAKIAAIKVEFDSDDEVDSDKIKGKKKDENKKDEKKEKKQEKKKGKPQDQEEASVDDKQEENEEDEAADADVDVDTNAASFQHDQDETEVTDANAVDMEALRKYELDRLRYYYAIVVCDTITNAELLYKECDGLEFESSSNVMDLRFVPDDVTFEEEPRDECDTMPTSYKAPSFYTKALQQSRVELTWDRDDPNRVQVLNKKFSKEDEMDDDIKAYLGSDDDEDGNGSDAVISATDSEDSDAISDDEHKKKVILKKRARNKFAALLDELKVDKDGNQPSMEIVFESGLKEVGEKILKDVQAKKAQAEETTWEKYLRERKEKRKAKKKARKEGTKIESKDAEESLYSDDDNDIPEDVDAEDPFFKDAFDGEEYEKKTEKDDDAPKKDTPKKEKKKKKKHQQETEEEKKRKERERAELELIMMPEAENVQTSNRVGYDLKALVRQEKEKEQGQKKKKKRGQEETPASTDDFSVDTSDPRFVHLYHDPAYAIDPTNPSFKPTAGTQQLLKEKQKRRAQQMQQEEEQVRQRKKQRQVEHAVSANNNTETSTPTSSSLASLVASVKRMSKQHNEKMEGKR